MRRRIRSSALTSLALLSTAALSNNNPLAFTTPGPIRRKILARSILQQSNSNSRSTEFTRYTATATTKKEQEQVSNSSNDNNDDAATNDNNGGSSSCPSSSTLSMMVDQQREFEINLGRAVDTLKRDYPKLLSNDPSWNIYHTDLEVIDPTGVSLHGLSNYKRAFSFIHAVVYMFYCEEKSCLTFRSTYDWARKSIR